MKTSAQLRLEFSQKHADGLADQLGVDPVRDRQPDKAGWTKRAVWYVTNELVTAVVGDQESRNVDDVLGFALLKAGDRPLRLVLPAAYVGPTLTRAAWFEHPIEIVTHENGDVSEPVRISRERTLAAAGGPETKPSLHLRNIGPQMCELVNWATAHPDLEAAHRPDVRAWSHQGQRVLDIRGRSGSRITAGIDAKAQPAEKRTAAQVEKDGGAEVKAFVEQGIAHAGSKIHQEAEEHYLQARLRDYPDALRLEHPVIREVAAFRPKGKEGEKGRGFIDLLGLDGFGDIVVVETKLGGDHMLVLQGLDYWIWANKNITWLQQRMDASPDAQLKVLYAVAGKKGTPPAISQYAERQLELLAPEILRSVVLIEEWKTDPIRAVWR